MATPSNNPPLLEVKNRRVEFPTRRGTLLAVDDVSFDIAPGDALLLETHPRFLEEQRHRRDFLLVSPVADSQPPRHERAWVAVTILAAMVVVASLESFISVSLFQIALVGAGLIVLLSLSGAVVWTSRNALAPPAPGE